MKIFRSAIFAFAIFPVAGTLSVFAEKTDEKAATELVEKRERAAQISGLRDLLGRRDAFFEASETLSESERARRATDLAERFGAFCSRFPNCVPALYFFAEFLRDGGELERAEKLLLDAEKIEPDFVPAKFLLAEIFAARGNVDEAFSRFSEAVSAEPGNSQWRGIFGEFLLDFRKRLLEEKCFASRDEIDAKMQSEFLAACASDAENFEPFWRFAESFYDVEKPDWAQALSAWERIERKLPAERRAVMKPVVALHRARILVELGRFDEADKILRGTAGVPALERSRRQVFDLLNQKKNGK